MGDRISAGLRSDVENKTKAVRDALAQQDTARVNTAADDLERTMQRIGQEVYSQQGAGASAGAGTTPGYGTQPGEETAPPPPETESYEGEYREI
jgi:hypothetical protein